MEGPDVEEEEEFPIRSTPVFHPEIFVGRVGKCRLQNFCRVCINNVQSKKVRVGETFK